MANFDLVMESDGGTFTPTGLQFTGTDNLEIFARILFWGIALKDIFATL